MRLPEEYRGKYNRLVGLLNILDCDFYEHKLYLKVEVNGVVYEGGLRTLPVKQSGDEEE